MCTFSIIPEACNLGEQMICRGGGEANCKNEIQPIESKFSQPVGRITQVALVKEKAFAKSEGISRATLRNNKSACYKKRSQTKWGSTWTGLLWPKHKAFQACTTLIIGRNATFQREVSYPKELILNNKICFFDQYVFTPMRQGATLWNRTLDAQGQIFFFQYLAYFIVHKQCSKRSFVQLVPGMWQTRRGIEHATERSAVEHNSHIGKSLVQTTLMILCRWNWSYETHYKKHLVSI